MLYSRQISSAVSIFLERALKRGSFLCDTGWGERFCFLKETKWVYIYKPV